MKSHICEVVQNEHNPTTGEDLHFNESNIIQALEHKTIKRWAYIRHDKDIYTAEDIKKLRDTRVQQAMKKALEETGESNLTPDLIAQVDETLPKLGDLKSPHWHVVLDCGTNYMDFGTVSKWFGVPENCIEAAKGRGALLDKVQYLTHELQTDKHHYDDSEVKANFGWRAELAKREENRIKYGRDLSAKDRMEYDVLYNGKTIKACWEEDPILYKDNCEKLDKLRLRYLSMQAPPKTRINFYISGKGGMGKGLMSKGLARSLFPLLKDDEEIFFEVGAEGTTFEGYDGQPVIIWNDCRAIALIHKLGDRGNVFDVFDPVGSRRRQNVKYNSCVLINKVNIVNSVQSYEEFLNGLAGEYKNKYGDEVKSEDKGQSYRRFPFIIPLHMNDFDLLVNKGWIDDDKNYEDYILYQHIRGNMEEIAKQCTSNPQLQRKMEAQALSIPCREYDKVKDKFEGAALDEADVLAELADYGKMPDDIAPHIIRVGEAVDKQQETLDEHKEADGEVKKDADKSDDNDIDIWDEIRKSKERLKRIATPADIADANDDSDDDKKTPEEITQSCVNMPVEDDSDDDWPFV